MDLEDTSKKIPPDLSNPLMPNNNEVTNNKEFPPLEDHSRPKDTRSRKEKFIDCMNSCGVFPIRAAFALFIVISSAPLVYILLNREYLDTQSLVGALTYMISSVQADPIMSIQLVSSSSCPAGTEQLILGIWPGTIDACYCGNYTSEQLCTREQASCRNLPAISPTNLPIWDGESWCVTRATLGSNYVRSTSCPAGFIECWIENCFSSSLGCPITNITLSTTPLNEDSVQYGTSKYYTPYHNAGEAALGSIEISINDIPCFNPFCLPLGTPYYLSAVQSTRCDEYGPDNLYSSKLQEDYEYNVLSDNNVSRDIFNLPGYSAFLNQTEAYLVARSKIPISSQEVCLNALNLDLLSQLDSDTSTYNSKISSTSYPLGLALFFEFLFLVIGLAWLSKNREDILIECLLPWIFLVHLVACIVLAVFLCLNDPSQNSTQNITVLYKNHCFSTGQPNQAIYQCYSAVNTIETMVPVLKFVGIISPIVSFLTFAAFIIAVFSNKNVVF